MTSILKWGWLGAIAFGIVLVGAGLFMVNEGRKAADDVRDALADERILSSEDAEVPLALIDSADEARAQAELIREHALEASGGKTYAEMERDDPARAVYLNSVTLRTALMESYMAFRTADLVVGVGVIVALLGLSHVALGGFLGLLVLKGNLVTTPRG